MKLNDTLNKLVSGLILGFLLLVVYTKVETKAFAAGTCAMNSQPVTGICTRYDNCVDPTPVCDMPANAQCPLIGSCVECTNADRSHCVECTEAVTTGCPSGKKYCSSSNTCVQCTRDGNGNSLGCKPNQSCTSLNICEDDTQTTCVSNTVSPCSPIKPCCDTDRFQCVRPNGNPNTPGTCKARTDIPTPNCDCRQGHASDDCSGDNPVCVAGGGSVCNEAHGMNGWCVNQTTSTTMCSCQNGFCSVSATGTIPCNTCSSACLPPDPNQGPNGGLAKPGILPTALDPSAFIGFITGLLIPIAVLISILRLIEGGYKFLLSEGDEAKISEGKEIMTSAVIGMIMAIAGISLLRIILNTFVK